jgi:membrane protease YdiL (CAAX protease family)
MAGVNRLIEPEKHILDDGTHAAGIIPQWRTLDVVLISLVIILAFLTAALGLRSLIQVDEPSENTILLSALLAVLEGIVLVGSVYFVGLRRRGLPWQVAGLQRPSPNWVFVGIVVGIIAIPLSAMIAILIQLAIGVPVENTQLPFLAPEGFTWFGAVSMFVLAGLVAPFAEELYFRGVLYQWMRQRWGVWPGILVSSVIFGAVHGEVSVAGAAFVLGLILAWAYERSGSLWIAILVHAINNGVKILALYLFLALGLAV